MSLTTEKLAKIGGDDFEKLVILYLRQKSPSLAKLIQTGLNPQGEAIKCKVDGILYMPETNECVAVASTVTELVGLKRKWLGGKKGKTFEIGDISKAGEEFSAWKDRTPLPTFKLYLAVNSYLENETELYKDAIQKGKTLNIDVEIIEGSILVHFLDYEAEGQFLRQQLLGIKAGRLSKSLFKDIAVESLSRHKQRYFVGDTNVIEIQRDIGLSILSKIGSANTPIVGIQAASGLGKSTVARQVGVRINASEGICIWCPAEAIRPYPDIRSLLNEVLHTFAPSLNDDAGDKAVEILKSLPDGLTLLVDDVNRVSTPQIVLEGVRYLTEQVKEKRLNVRFLIPIWNNTLSGSPEENKDWSIQTLEAYSNTERERMVSTTNGQASSRLRALVNALNGDPFLSGLGRTALAESVQLSENTSDIIREIVAYGERQIVRKASAHYSQATESEYADAIGALIRLVLQADNPEPTWAEIKDNLPSDVVLRIRDLCKTGQLIWIETNSSTEIVRWRHEKLRDATIGKWIAENVLSNRAATEPSIADVLSNPGLAEALALAVCCTTTTDSRDQALDDLANNQPLALAELVRIKAFGEKLEEDIAVRLKNTLSGWELKHDFALDPRWEILARLRQADSTIVLKITESMPLYWHVALARFRNGDIEAGLRLMRDYHLDTIFPQLEQAVEQFALKRESDKESVASELTSRAKDQNLTYRVLALVGYLGWPELSTIACQIWQELPNVGKKELLVYFVWALNRCGNEEAQPYLKRALFLTKEFSNEEVVRGNFHDAPERHEKFIAPLRHTLRWKITNESLATWIAVINEDSELRAYAYLLSLIDHPTALETYIKLRANGKVSFFDYGEFSADDNGEISGSSLQSSKLPTAPETRDHLLKIIQSDENPEVRKWAFKFWRRSATVQDLPALRSFPQSDPIFEDLFRLRILLRDKSVVNELAERIKANPEKWCGYSYGLCDNELVVDALLEKIEDAYSDIYHKSLIQALPNRLPAYAVERLVREKRNWLEVTPRMWPALWGSDNPNALRFVQDCLKVSNERSLEHFFTITGHYKPITHRMLDAIGPFLNRFPEDEVVMLASHASSDGYPRWAAKHFPNPQLLGKPLTNRWIIEDEGLAILNEAAEIVSRGVEAVECLPNFYRLSRNRELCFDIHELIRNWVTQNPESDRIRVSALLLSEIGEGDDVTWWSTIPVNEKSESHSVWTYTLYYLRRRRWLKTN